MTESLPLTKSFNPRKNYPFLSSKFKRRCPMTFFYIPIECPLAKNCDDGLCPLSHTKLEVIFHPILNKTKRCSMALMNVCNFAQRCAFFHNTNDRISSHLAWLVWQKKWNLWETCSELLSAKFNLDIEVARKLSQMIESRFDTQAIFETFNPRDHSIISLEKQLNAMLDSCETPETTASTLTPDVRSYFQFSPKSLHSPIDRLRDIHSLYK